MNPANTPSERKNCFDLIRLLLALAVLNSHFNIYGGFPPDWTVLLMKERLGFAGLAVLGFFGLSGYLVSASCAGSMVGPGGWRSFARRRFLRIMPGFWFCLLMTAFVIAPLIAWMRGHPLTTADLWAPGGPWDYVKQNALLIIRRYEIGDVLRGAPYGAINGNLWSLLPEVVCYAVTLGLAWLGVFGDNRWFAPAVLGFMTALNVINIQHDTFFGPTAIVLNRWYQPMGAYFVGQTLFCYRDRVRLNDWRIAVFAIVFLGFLFRFGGVMLGAPLLVPLALLSLGQMVTVHLKHDLSYGVYIYGSPMLQVALVIPFVAAHHALYLCVGTVFAFAMAALSWWLVESPCIRLGRK